MNRLPLDVYREPGLFFVTMTTEARRPWFQQPHLTEYCAGALRDSCRAQGFELMAYCFMPDHAHILVSTDEANDLVGLIHAFKQKSGWWFRTQQATGALKGSPTPPSPSRPRLWQKSYHDHVLRSEEDAGAVARYIMENPVRAGLAGSVEEYPHAWSGYGVPEPV